MVADKCTDGGMKNGARGRCRSCEARRFCEKKFVMSVINDYDVFCVCVEYNCALNGETEMTNERRFYVCFLELLYKDLFSFEIYGQGLSAILLRRSPSAHHSPGPVSTVANGMRANNFPIKSSHVSTSSFSMGYGTHTYCTNSGVRCASTLPLSLSISWNFVL